MYNRYTKTREKGTQALIRENPSNHKERNQKTNQRRTIKKKKQKTSNKMAISTYLSITILNVSGLNAPIKRQRVAFWIKNKTHPYTAYKKLTSDQKAHID